MFFIATHVYEYYPPQPLDVGGFPMHWAWLNSAGMLGGGFLLYLVVPRVRGWTKTVIILLPAYGFAGAYGLIGWPAWMSLNWNMSRAESVFVDLFSFLLAVIAVRGIAEVVCTDVQREPATPAAVTSAKAQTAQRLQKAHA